MKSACTDVVTELWSRQRYTIFSMLLLSLMPHVLFPVAPVIFGDTWGNLGAYLNRTLCLQWNTVRPFLFCGPWAVYSALGLDVHLHNLTMVFMGFLNGLLLLMALEQLWPRRPGLNGAVALLFLVFPTVWSRHWFVGTINFGAGPFLSSCFFLFLWWRRGHWLSWLIGVLSLCVALGTWEVSVGLIVVASIGVSIAARDQSGLRRISYFIPAVLAILYSIWRWLWQVSAGTAYGHSVESASFSPSILISRLIYGYRVNLQWGWTDLILRLLPPLEVNARFARLIAVSILAGLVALFMVMGGWIARTRSKSRQITERDLEIVDTTKNLISKAVLGLLVLGVGYFPIILAVFPGMDYGASRAHYLPSIGAAIFICAVLFGIAKQVTRNPHHARMAALAGVIPLLILGVAGQLLVQRQTNRAWIDQKQMWQQLFELAPDIDEGTHVIFLLTGYEKDPWGPRPLLSGPWGVTSALNILYGKSNLHSDFAYAPPNEVLSIRGEKLVVSYYGEKELSVIETVVFLFDVESRSLVHVKSIDRDGKTVPVGPGCILDTRIEATDYRWLVQ